MEPWTMSLRAAGKCRHNSLSLRISLTLLIQQRQSGWLSHYDRRLLLTFITSPANWLINFTILEWKPATMTSIFKLQPCYPVHTFTVSRLLLGREQGKRYWLNNRICA